MMSDHPIRTVISKIVVMAVVALSGATDLVAQDRPENVPDLSGNWGKAVTPEDPNTYSCGGLLDPFGNPRELCQAPIDKAPLNARALAWAQFFDEPVSPKWDCAAASLPTLLGDGTVWNLKQAPHKVTLYYEHDEVVREVWLDGRKHPPPAELFYLGHSIGWYEGNDLVVETTNFTFDPDGLDDHAHIATSVRKKMIERYTRTSADTLRITITIEDPIFLKAPFTFAHDYRKTDREPFGWWDCDPEIGRAELEGTLPPKYPD